MKTRMNRNMMVIALSLVLMVSMSSWALAKDAMHSAPQGMENGSHHGDMMKKEGGKCPMAAMGCMGVSREDMQKIRGMCAQFFKETLSLRQGIQSKKLALASELVKSAPDAKVARALQTELCHMKAQMAQKRLTLLLDIKKFAPAADLRWLSKCNGMGMHMEKRHMGYHHGGMMDDDD